jgi:MFS transporter, PAT family, beta-lactamase induction signal transducer AmpG
MPSLLQSLKPLLDRRFLYIFVLGFSSGFPWVLHGSVLTLWMRSEGLTRSAVGYIGIVTAIYAFKWIWSPLIDLVRLPILARHTGHYRAWILLMQLFLAITTWLLGRAEPTGSLFVLGLFTLGVATASATQDIAIDAYRILLFRADEIDTKQPYGSAVITAGWWSGYGFIGGAVALWLGGQTMGFTWPEVYNVAAGTFIVLMLFVVMMPEPARDPRASATPQAFNWDGWFRRDIAAPFVEFFQRCGYQLGFAILGFLLLFRFGEAILGDMSLVFYTEIGFTTEQLAFYNRFLGGLSIVAFSFMGAAVNSSFGVMRGLLIGGIAMATANLLYVVMAHVGPDPRLFMATLLIDNFCQAFATVATLTFMTYFTSRTYTGTQFALMSSISTFGRTTLAASSGLIIDSMDGNWTLFFIFTTLAVIPSLLLLVWMGKLLERHRAVTAS